MKIVKNIWVRLSRFTAINDVIVTRIVSELLIVVPLATLQRIPRRAGYPRTPNRQTNIETTRSKQQRGNTCIYVSYSGTGYIPTIIGNRIEDKRYLLVASCQPTSLSQPRYVRRFSNQASLVMSQHSQLQSS